MRINTSHTSNNSNDTPLATSVAVPQAKLSHSAAYHLNRLSVFSFHFSLFSFDNSSHTSNNFNYSNKIYPYIIFKSPCNAPAALIASNIAIRSLGVAPTALSAFTKSSTVVSPCTSTIDACFSSLRLLPPPIPP